MLVDGLLRAKGDGVVTIAPDTTIGEVVTALARHGVGALVVSTDGRDVEGIVSERDVVHRLAERGAALLDAEVRTIMVVDVITCDLHTTVDELSTTMTEQRVRHVPVVVDGELRGIVSIGDVVKDRIRDLLTETRTLHDYIVGGR